MGIWFKYSAIIVASYLWGSVCWGLVLSFLVKHEDIRLKDNPGLSGSVRQYGWPYGMTVGLLDAAKGYVLSFILQSMAIPDYIRITAFAAVVIGHNWPIFFQFRGGGGIATAIGILLRSYVIGVLWALPFAAAAGLAWKLTPKLKAKTHFSPFITAVGAVPFVVWLVLNKPLYPDCVMVLVLACSIIIKGNQFHVQAQRLRRYASGMRNHLMNYLEGRDGEPPEK